MAIEERIDLLEDLLVPWKAEIGNDYLGYRNHVYRMIHFCLALRDCSADERQKVVIAGCFHDLGIWAQDTFDYLPPSMSLAREYLEQHGLSEWTAEMELMIAMHHKLTRYRDGRHPLVEVFRRGDLVDVSLGLIQCGLPKQYIDEVKQRFPNAGFHKRLVQLEVGWVARHPLNPLPIFKW